MAAATVEPHEVENAVEWVSEPQQEIKNEEKEEAAERLEVPLEAVDSILQDSTVYSRANEASLKRGQLWLLPQEGEKLNAVSIIIQYISVLEHSVH